jgi:FkbM family methyltransferase
MSYSQGDEEIVICRLLEKEPLRRFLDIGAHDGVTFSNTRALSDKGWSGVLVEPSSRPFVGLMEHYNKRNGTLVNVAIVPNNYTGSKLVRWFDSRGDMISTMVDSHRATWARDGKDHYQEIYVPVTTVSALLDKFPGPYSFINLDVEGLNWEVFCDLPLRDLGVKVVCVEYQAKKAQIIALAEQQGYRCVHSTQENLILEIGIKN